YTGALAGLTGRPVLIADGTTGTTAGAALLAAGRDLAAATGSVAAVTVPAWASALPACRDRFAALVAGS
ncbi:hypothetical protein KC218_28625, partial [Mycobacterium tuberculosis]|nr:hypothetical protein [Mycobacterium tuberculosis]